jgi:predicted secreted protein
MLILVSSRLSAALVLLCALVSLLLAACAPTPTPTSLTLHAADSGRTLHLHPNQSFQVALAYAGGDGYQWTYAISDSSVLAQSGDSLYQNFSPISTTPGTYIFPFQTQSAGKTFLLFSYTRDWEGNMPPLRSVLLSVQVT